MKRDDTKARRSGRRSSDAARRRFRPTLEVLENRWLPSITVNTLADVVNPSDGVTSLREAIAASPAGGTIDFSVTGTISLALGAVVVQDRLTPSPQPLSPEYGGEGLSEHSLSDYGFGFLFSRSDPS